MALVAVTCVKEPPDVALHSKPFVVIVTLSGFVMVAFRVAVVSPTAVAALVVTIGSFTTGPEPLAVTVRFLTMAGGWTPPLTSFLQTRAHRAVEVEVGLAFGLGIFATTWMVSVSLFRT